MRIPGQTRCTLCMMRRVTVEQKRTKNGSFSSIGGFGSDPLSLNAALTRGTPTAYRRQRHHMTTKPRGSRPTLLLTIEPDPYDPYRAQCQMMQPPAWSRYEERYYGFLPVPAWCVPRSLRRPCWYSARSRRPRLTPNPDIDGDGIPNTWR